MKRNFSVFALTAACVAAGCGGTQVTQNKPDFKQGVTTSEEDKIKDALKKNGITKDIAALVDMDDGWLVTLKLDGLGPNGEPPPGRPIPEKVIVKKTTYEVIRQNPPGGGRKVDVGGGIKGPGS